MECDVGQSREQRNNVTRATHETPQRQIDEYESTSEVLGAEQVAGQPLTPRRCAGRRGGRHGQPFDSADETVLCEAIASMARASAGT